MNSTFLRGRSSCALGEAAARAVWGSALNILRAESYTLAFTGYLTLISNRQQSAFLGAGLSLKTTQNTSGNF